MNRAALAAAGFQQDDEFNGLTLHSRGGGASEVLLVCDGAESRRTRFGNATTLRELLQAESEARMLRAIAGGMTEGPGKAAMLAHADAVAPLGEIWTG